MHIKDKGNGPPLLFSYRALVSVLAMFGFANLYIQRMDLPVAVVCMINHTALNIAANKSEVEFSDCGGTGGNASQDMEVRLQFLFVLNEKVVFRNACSS